MREYDVPRVSLQDSCCQLRPLWTHSAQGWQVFQKFSVPPVTETRTKDPECCVGLTGFGPLNFQILARAEIWTLDFGLGVPVKFLGKRLSGLQNSISMPSSSSPAVIIASYGERETLHLLYYYTTILLYYYTTILLYYYTTILLYYYTTILLYYYTTILLYYYTTILYYYYTTTVLLLYYYYTTTILLSCRFREELLLAGDPSAAAGIAH